MGLFQEYIKKNLDAQQVDETRRALLKKIGSIRKTEVVSYAARIQSGAVPVDVGISYEDILPFSDLVESIDAKRISVILETPGGIGEVGRSIVERLHEKFEWVEFIVPGKAMSTGTIMCLGGHEILMGPNSQLGPIDAQLFQDGKRFSADALIEGFNAIKTEVNNSGGRLNPAYIPILQRISPGELQNALNALEFARATVADWLVRYKFANWEKDGVPVPEDRRKSRAREIAERLAKQSEWHTHSRSLRISDLVGLGLKITDFSADKDLYGALQRYLILLRFSFESGPVYKIYESTTETLAKRFQVPVAPQDALRQAAQQAPTVGLELKCSKCGLVLGFQLDFAPGQPLQPGVNRFPNKPSIACPRCGNQIDLKTARAQIEQQLGRKALDPQPEK